LGDSRTPPAAAARLRGAAAHYAERLEPTAVGRFWARLLEVEFIDRSVALAAKLLVCIFPLMAVVAALSPDSVRVQIMETFVSRFGLSGVGLDFLRQSFASPQETRTATGVVGAIVTLAFAISSTTALQRTYLRAWRRPAGGGLSNKGRGAAWVGGILLMLAVLSLVNAILRGPVAAVTSWVVGSALAVGLWWWTAHLMLRGEVRWRPLLPTGLLTGVGSWLYTLAAAVWFPVTVAKNVAQFGAFGLSLAFVTWLTGFAVIIVGAAVAGPALTEGDDRLARWLRGPDDDYLVPGAAPPLPGPVRPLRLTDAFARSGRGSDT
jgi:membrane protein